MALIKRISRLITANINSLLDSAEDPAVMVKQIIRDMEEAVIELRREAVRAVAREKQLEKQIATATELASELEDKARSALKTGNEELARAIVSKKLLTTETLERLEKEHGSAREAADRLRSDMSRIKEQMQTARKKRDELISRKQAAEAEIRSQEVVQRSAELSRDVTTLASSGKAIAQYEEAILKMESEAEAMKELMQEDIKTELDFQKLDEDMAIDEELARLKSEQGSD